MSDWEDDADEITTFESEHDLQNLPDKPGKRKNRRSNKLTVNPNASDTISLSGTLKRGFKLPVKDAFAEGRGLNSALKLGLKTSVSAHSNSLKRGESLQNLSYQEDHQAPSKGMQNKWFSIRGKKKEDDAISVASVVGARSPRSPRSPGTRVLSDTYEDTVSMLEGLLFNTESLHAEEGIRDTIGRKMVVTLKKMIKLERSIGDRADPKVLTLTHDRCFIMGVKPPFKAETNFHFLDIQSMDSPSYDRLNISTTNGKIYFMRMIGSDDSDQIIGRIAMSLRTIFPGVTLSKIVKASLEPLSRQKLIQSMLNQADLAESGPCGNFTVMYESLCNYLGLPVREEVGWDVDTIYLSQNCREINIKDFDLPDQKDFIPIVSVLMYNRWFSGLVVRNVRLNSDVFDAILKVVGKSNTLSKLVLEGVGMKGEFANRLSQEMVENKECCIEVLDLVNNPIEDRAVMHLSGALPLLRHGSGLRTLKLDRTGLTAKGLSGLCQALRSSISIGRSLTHLTLSDNLIKAEEAVGLYNYLSNPNNLKYLEMSGTDCAVEIYISAMSKGCLDHLETINLSKNHFFGKGNISRHPHYLEDEYTGIRKGKETVLPNTFLEYFKRTKALKSIDISGTRIPAEAVRQMMDGLGQNYTENLQVSLNLSSGELRAAGAQVLGGTIGNITNVVGLDISDNNLDLEIPSLLGWIQQNRSIKDLKIGRNFGSIKPKHMKAVMESIVHLVQEEGSCLESLSLADSKLREWTTVVLGCLGSNTSLSALDISGNQMGDSGARELAKALQINSKVRLLMIDRNSLTAAGFQEISSALDKNFTLRYMPYPVNDAVAAMKNQPERTQTSLAHIQDLLLRNANTNKDTNDQQFRLQRAVACTAQEVLDRVSEKVDDAVNALELLEADISCSEVVVTAKGLVKDAKNSKQLLSDIYGLGMEKTTGDHSQLRRKLNQMAKEMDAMIQDHIKNTVQSMTKNAEAQCPYIFESISGEVQQHVKDKSSLPENFVRDHVMKQASTEVMNKVSELNLTVATLISDKVTDTLLAALSQCNTTLTEQLNKKKHERELARQEYMSPVSKEFKDEDVPDEKVKDEVEGGSDKEVDDGESKSPDHKPSVPIKSATNDVLPAIRQERAASIARRKQRPISNVALDLDYKNKPETEEVTAPSIPVILEPPEVLITVDQAEEQEKTAENNDETNKLNSKIGVEPVYATVNKKQENEKQEKDLSDSSPPEMVHDEEITEEKSADETVIEKSDDDLPDLLPASDKKLDHVTKGRPRGPNKRRQARPAKPQAETDAAVDDFFTASVSSTDFDKVPTLAEEKEIAAKEEPKKTPKRMPGMGMGMLKLTPDMLQLKKKSHEPEKENGATEEKSSEEKNGIAPEKSEDKNDVDVENERPKSGEGIRKKPPGAMGLPGMGFGGDVMAELRLKKLNKSKATDEKNDSKHETVTSPTIFGQSMLKKTSAQPPSPGAEKNENNNNNNNNIKTKDWAHLSSTPNRFKSRSFERRERPEIEQRPATKSSVISIKPSPPPAAAKPSLKGKPPPLPSKPKPASAVPELNSRFGRARPVSEFIDANKVPSSVRMRAASWGKDLKKTKTPNEEDKK